MKEKAFNNFKTNGIHLTFPNGNVISTIWDHGSYSENHDALPKGDDLTARYSTPMQSDNCEVMVLECSDALLSRLKKKFDGDNPFGYLSIADWLYIVNAVAKDDKLKESSL